jgi:hypothetical protein
MRAYDKIDRVNIQIWPQRTLQNRSWSIRWLRVQQRQTIRTKKGLHGRGIRKSVFDPTSTHRQYLHPLRVVAASGTGHRQSLVASRCSIERVVDLHVQDTSTPAERRFCLIWTRRDCVNRMRVFHLVVGCGCLMRQFMAQSTFLLTKMSPLADPAHQLEATELALWITSLRSCAGRQVITR